MAGSGVSDLLNLMYFLDSREAKKRERVQEVEKVQGRSGSVGDKQVPESISKRHGLTDQERGTTDTPEYKGRQFEGEQSLMQLQEHLNTFQGAYGVMQKLLEGKGGTDEERAALTNMGNVMKNMMTKSVEQHKRLYGLEPSKEGEPPNFMEQVLGDTTLGAASPRK
jgi:hypothetical protein